MRATRALRGTKEHVREQGIFFCIISRKHGIFQLLAGTPIKTLRNGGMENAILKETKGTCMELPKLYIIFPYFFFLFFSVKYFTRCRTRRIKILSFLIITCKGTGVRISKQVKLSGGVFPGGGVVGLPTSRAQLLARKIYTIRAKTARDARGRGAKPRTGATYNREGL